MTHADDLVVLAQFIHLDIRLLQQAPAPSRLKSPSGFHFASCTRVSVQALPSLKEHLLAAYEHGVVSTEIVC